MGLFKAAHGIIPACDVEGIDELAGLIQGTCDHEAVVGYKIGIQLVIPHGLARIASVIRNYTTLPIIYDHQKFGTDIPDICGGKILKVLKEAGVDGLIIFPQSGIETLKAVVTGCSEYGLVPIVGGEMTHAGYLVQQGGYISDKGPEKMYRDAAALDVTHFVVPGTKIDKMNRYAQILGGISGRPNFLFPGVGSGQGGDIVQAFSAVKSCPSYAIVGRGIYAQPDKKLAVNNLWSYVSLQIPEISNS